MNWGRKPIILVPSCARPMRTRRSPRSQLLQVLQLSAERTQPLRVLRFARSRRPYAAPCELDLWSVDGRGCVGTVAPRTGRAATVEGYGIFGDLRRWHIRVCDACFALLRDLPEGPDATLGSLPRSVYRPRRHRYKGPSRPPR